MVKWTPELGELVISDLAKMPQYLVASQHDVSEQTIRDWTHNSDNDSHSEQAIIQFGDRARKAKYTYAAYRKAAAQQKIKERSEHDTKAAIYEFEYWNGRCEEPEVLPSTNMNVNLNAKVKIEKPDITPESALAAYNALLAEKEDAKE